MVKVNRKSQPKIIQAVHIDIAGEDCQVLLRKPNMYELLDYEEVGRGIARELSNEGRVSKDSVRDLVYLLMQHITHIGGLVEDDPTSGDEVPLNWKDLDDEEKESILVELVEFDDLSKLYQELGKIGRLTEEEKKS